MTECIQPYYSMYHSLLTDIDGENSSDSGFSVSSSEIPIVPVCPHDGIVSCFYIVKIVPIQLVLPCYPINETPCQQVESRHLLIKWSLPPPSAPLVPLPGWESMP